MTPAAITLLALLITACVMALLALVMAVVNLRLWRLPEEVPKFRSSEVPKCESAEGSRTAHASQAALVNSGTSELPRAPPPHLSTPRTPSKALPKASPTHRSPEACFFLSREN